MHKKIKVAWITHLANPHLNEVLPLKLDAITSLYYMLKGRALDPKSQEFAIWNTNAINGLMNYTEEIELHVIAPYPYLRCRIYDYIEDGIYYHFFKDQQSSIEMLYNRFTKSERSYRKNQGIILDKLEEINPDIVEIIGIENPYYASCASSIDKKYPLLVHLQTLVNDPKFEKNYPISHSRYLAIAECEKKAILRADYICTTVEYFKTIIKDSIKPEANFLSKVLVLGENINLTPTEKRYDFVYYAADISKASDWALEAFILASQKHPGITLDIVGGYSESLYEQLSRRLSEHSLAGQVKFEGRLPTHDDVIRQIRKSRFAVIPLKIDLVSGTIRESMANGLPVVSTITPGTPALNKDRETLLISEPGNHEAMAYNMCRLLEDSELEERLRENGAKYMSDNFSNSALIKQWVEGYQLISSKSL